MNKKPEIIDDLVTAGLTSDEALLYVELLKGPMTYLSLSKITSMNRTKVYRVIESLEAKSLVSKHVDDRGSFLITSDPSSLEVDILNAEQVIATRRRALGKIMPVLSRLQGKTSKDFAIKTYDGTAGFKQMCWHELKTNGEVVSLGNGTIEQLVSDDTWALSHRYRQIQAGYKIRDLVNYDYTTRELPELSSDLLLEAGVYSHRLISPSIIMFDSQTVIYNDVVAIYHWKQEKKVGIEIISQTYADMMRQIFEHYWEIAEK